MGLTTCSGSVTGMESCVHLAALVPGRVFQWEQSSSTPWMSQADQCLPSALYPATHRILKLILAAH